MNNLDKVQTLGTGLFIYVKMGWRGGVGGGQRKSEREGGREGGRAEGR